MEKKPIEVIISGLPGKMAALVAETISKRDEKGLFLYGQALTGINQPKEYKIPNINTIDLIPPEKHEEWLKRIAVGSYSQRIIVDFTQPDAVNRNAELYCKHKAPFVMGTTGGDRKALEKTVLESGNTAVIAPNMAKPIVLLQSMLEYAAENFPDALKGFEMIIAESHQESKKDTSGTARAMVSYFNKLGVDFSVDDIIKLRNPKEQTISLDVPLEYLSGHGWHNYKLKSKDKTVGIQLVHNVNGRQVYADGTIDAIKFLAKKIEKGEKGIYSMIDVLKGE